MAEQLTLDVAAPQLTWLRATARGSCGRDPEAGPGSCTYWWEGCPKAEQRGCFRLWAASDETQAHWFGAAPADWTEAPTELPPVTADRLRDRGMIDVREPKGERWQWRRRPQAAAA